MLWHHPICMPNTHGNEPKEETQNRLNLKWCSPTEIKWSFKKKISETSSYFKCPYQSAFFFLRLFLLFERNKFWMQLYLLRSLISKLWTCYSSLNEVTFSVCKSEILWLQFRKIIRRKLLVRAESLDFRLALSFSGNKAGVKIAVVGKGTSCHSNALVFPSISTQTLTVDCSSVHHSSTNIAVFTQA